jgi:hypothetical protein
MCGRGPKKPTTRVELFGRFFPWFQVLGYVEKAGSDKRSSLLRKDILIF